MSGSATAIWIIVAVAVAGLAVWLGSVALAARKPYRDARTGNGSAGQSRAECTSAPAAAWHRDGTSRWPPGRSLPGTRFTRARKILPTRNPGTPGRARGARWIGNNGTGPLVPATGRTSAAAGGKS